MHAPRPGQGPARAKVLYFFRSPSNLKVGRTALDPEVVEALEHTHPDLTFDGAGMLREPGPQPARDVREAREMRRRRPERSLPPAAPAPPADRAPDVPVAAAQIDDE